MSASLAADIQRPVSSRRRVERFVASIARELGRDPDTWWLARVMRVAWYQGLAPLTASRLGVLASADSRRPECVRLVAQPNPAYPAPALADMIEAAAAPAVELAAALKRMDASAGTAASKWKIALGAAVDGEDEDARLYVGTLGQIPGEELGVALEPAGLWPSSAEPVLPAALEPLCEDRLYVGVARRFGRRPARAFYLAGEGTLSRDLLSRVCRRLEPWPADAFLRMVLAALGDGRIEQEDHSWAAALDSGGRLVALKLEIGSRAVDRLTLPDSVPPSKRLARIAAAAAGYGFRPHPQIVAFRLTAAGPSATRYLRFDLEPTPQAAR